MTPLDAERARLLDVSWLEDAMIDDDAAGRSCCRQGRRREIRRLEALLWCSLWGVTWHLVDLAHLLCLGVRHRHLHPS